MSEKEWIGIDDALVAGGVFSEDADALLRQLSITVDTLDVSRQPADLLGDAEWSRVVHLAGRTLAAIPRSATPTLT